MCRFLISNSLLFCSSSSTPNWSEAEQLLAIFSSRETHSNCMHGLQMPKHLERRTWTGASSFYSTGTSSSGRHLNRIGGYSKGGACGGMLSNLLRFTLKGGIKPRKKSCREKKRKPAINKPRQLQQLESIPALGQGVCSLNHRALFLPPLTSIAQSVDGCVANGPASPRFKLRVVQQEHCPSPVLL